eukprot:TRINITY_DN10607_c0_g1_i4.p2 TRINITY_DN10607_c0_g1~~TRINITY_DN10607_c0_g1_i4.p2  ORF type:complete len:153 (+),score=48.84 TRINITY_DN10607_c0_g1_i4:162-620(+)
MEDSSCPVSEFTCSVSSGALFAAGWWWFVDGLVSANQHDGTDFGFQMWLPGIFATLGMIGVNMTNPSDLREDGLGDDPDVQKAKVFFFFSGLFLFASLVAAVWICIADFGSQSAERTTTYPGVAIIMQAVIITISTVLMWVGRGMKGESYGF